mgnify:FL=1
MDFRERIRQFYPIMGRPGAERSERDNIRHGAVEQWPARVILSSSGPGPVIARYAIQYCHDALKMQVTGHIKSLM